MSAALTTRNVAHRDGQVLVACAADEPAEVVRSALAGPGIRPYPAGSAGAIREEIPRARAGQPKAGGDIGYQHAELAGRPVEFLIPADLRAAHRSRAAYTKAPKARPMRAGGRLAGLRKDGATLPVEISLSPVPTATGHLTLAVIRHVTGNRRQEDRSAAGSRSRSRGAGAPRPGTARPDRQQPFQRGPQPAGRRRPAPVTCPASASQKLSGALTTPPSARSVTMYSPPAAKGPGLVPDRQKAPRDAAAALAERMTALTSTSQDQQPWSAGQAWLAACSVSGRSWPPGRLLNCDAVP